MLVEELADIFRVVRDDYLRLHVREFIASLATILSGRNINGGQNYNVDSARLRARANEIIAEQFPLLNSRRIKDLFSNSAYRGMLPSDIARQVLVMLPAEMAYAAQSSEAQIFLSRFDGAISSFNTFLAVAAGFNQTTLEEDSDRITFTLLIPNTSEWTFDILQKKSEKFRDFFALASEYCLGTHEQPAITHMAMSDLTVFIETSTQFAATLLPLLKELLSYAKLYIDTRNSLDGLKRLSTPDTSLEEKITQAFEEQLTARVKTLAMLSDGNEGRRNEIEAKFVSTCRYVVGEAANGARLELRDEASFSIKPTSDPHGSEKAALLISELKKAQDLIDQARAATTAPLLLPTNDG